MILKNESNAEDAIRLLYQKLLESWATGNGSRYAEQFTDDADYIIASGILEKGREEIAAGHQQIFNTWAQNTQLIGQIKSIRFLSPDIAFIVATGSILMPGQSAPDPHENTIYSLVAANYQGQWRFTAYQNTPIQNDQQS